MSRRFLVLLSLVFLVAVVPAAAQSQMKPETPPELVQTYEAIADAILSTDEAEENLVKAILSTTYGHAMSAKKRCDAKIAAGEDARTDLEHLAAYVSQLGNEGDSAVAGVRKRLVEGGHHHNAMGEQEGLYDEGFVIVTRAAKKVFLQAATEIGKLMRSPNAEALNAQWAKVDAEFKALMKAEGK